MPAATAPPTPVPDPATAGREAAAKWVQALQPLVLWSGPDGDAIQLGTAARWDYFQIVTPQQGSRLFVIVKRTNGYAWVDALSVGPSGSPPADWPPADLPPPPEDLSIGWLATFDVARLWGDKEGVLLLGMVPPWSVFKQMEPQDGPWIRVQDPYAGVDAYLEASLVGPIPKPERLEAPSHWWGLVAVDGANLRPVPTTKEAAVANVPYGSPVVVSAWVEGEEVIKDNPTWAMLADGAYLYSSVLRPVALPVLPPPPTEALRESGKWLDLNLTHQVIGAYEGETPVYVARVSTGRPGWETDAGVFRVGRRVEKETMDSATLLGRDARRADYRIENIRWTQYFTPDGKALHENYWKPRDQFGIPSSHGCVGLVAEDAQWLWEWAALGTPIYSHY